MSDRGESRKGKELKVDNSESSSDSDHDPDNKVMENAVSSSVAPQKSQPMKRGLSSHYYGRSRSFNDLSDIKIDGISELGKEEDPSNKKRRLIRSQDDLDIGTRRTPNLDSNRPIKGHPTSDNTVTALLDSIFPLLPSNNAAAENDDDIMELESIFPLLPSNTAEAENEDNISDARNEVGFEDISLDDLDRVLETECSREDGISLDDLTGEIIYTYEECVAHLNDGRFYDGRGLDDAGEENKEIHNDGDDQIDKGKKDDEHDHDDEENKRTDDQSDKGKKDDEHHDADDEENKEIDPKSS